MTWDSTTDFPQFNTFGICFPVKFNNFNMPTTKAEKILWLIEEV